MGLLTSALRSGRSIPVARCGTFGTPIVGGRTDSCLQASPRCAQSNDASRFFDQLPEEIGKKSNGPHNRISSSNNGSMSAH